MKYNKNADTILFLLKIHSLWVQAVKKRVKNNGFWEYFTATSTESWK